MWLTCHNSVKSQLCDILWGMQNFQTWVWRGAPGKPGTWDACHLGLLELADTGERRLEWGEVSVVVFMWGYWKPGVAEAIWALGTSSWQSELGACWESGFTGAASGHWSLQVQGKIDDWVLWSLWEAWCRRIHLELWSMPNAKVSRTWAGRIL